METSVPSEPPKIEIKTEVETVVPTGIVAREIDYKVLLNRNEILDLIDEIHDKKVVAFDFETAPMTKYREIDKAALDPNMADIVGISFSHTPGQAVYIPIRHLRGQDCMVPRKELLETLAYGIFYNRGILKICHNMAFESSFLYKYGVILQPPVYDTICASQLSLKTKNQFRKLFGDSGLKVLSKELLGKEQMTFEDVTEGKYFDELNPDDPKTLRYACEDADFTLQLYYYFKDWFKNNIPRHHQLCLQIESPTAVLVGMMKYNGVCVNKDYLESKNAGAIAQIAETRENIMHILRAWIEIDMMGFSKFNPDSPKQLGNMLFQKIGLPVIKTTDSGAYSTDDETLKKLRDWCQENDPKLVPLFNLLMEYRSLRKTQSTYVEGLLKAINPVTGKIHTDFFQLLTDTGRFSSRNPNLQNLPNAYNDPVGIREALIPSPGHVFLDFDFSQIELRVAAVYSQDKAMLDVYQQGLDIHAMTMNLLFGVPLTEARDKKWGEHRTIAKSVNFGYTYGLSAAGLQRDLETAAGLKKSMDECEDIIKTFQRSYPGLQEYQRKIIRYARQKGYVETLFGRRRYLPDINSRKYGSKSFAERTAMNTPIQGTAADILKKSITELVKGLVERPWIRPLLQIHDELLFEVPEDRVDEAAIFIKECMEQSPGQGFNVDIIAEGEWGHNFNDKKSLGG